MSSQTNKCDALAALHAAPSAWVIPNPWDVGSALDLERLGFKALATSSSAFAYTLGLNDGEVTLAEKLAHCEAIANAVQIPVSVDFEDGFSGDPVAVAANIRSLAATGVAGCSIEDFSRTEQQVFDFNHAVERIEAAVEAVAGLGLAFQLTARAESLLRKHADLDHAIKRLQAYGKAGAHVLYAPGLTTLAQVKTVAASIDRPLNVLLPFMPEATLADLSAAGATRVSMGGALQQSARSGFIAAAKALL